MVHVIKGKTLNQEKGCDLTIAGYLESSAKPERDDHFSVELGPNIQD